jgi:O-antigen/teichoic acid export membrane protein
VLKEYKEAGYFFRLVGKNSLSLFFVNALPAFSSFIVGIMASRCLGVSAFGKYVAAYNFYGLFYFLPLFGLGVFIIRDLSKDKAMVNKYLTNVGFISLIASAACILLIFSLTSFMKYDSVARTATYIVSFAIFPSSLILLTQAFFIAAGKIRYAFIAAIAETAVKIILSFLILILGFGIRSLMMIQVFSKFMGLALSVYFFLRCSKNFRMEFDLGFCREVCKKVAFTFALITILNNFFTKIDILTLSGVRGMNEVGLYSCASKFVWIGYLFLNAATTALLPVISRLYSASKEVFEAGSNRIFKCLLAALLPFLIVGFLLSDRLILVFFGGKFINSIPVLKILIWSVLFLGIFSFCDVVLIAANRQKQILYTLSFSLGVAFFLNVFLSYKLGYIGTCIAVLFSMAIFAVLELFLVSRFVRLRLSAVLGAPLVALGAALLFIYLFRERMSVFLLIIPSLLIYLLVLIVLRIFTKIDLIFFKKLWREELV